ncbi:hypothetical protein VCHA43P273_400021 [Vibrio chagasii]|nr:hypothetical protein VCHA43P273_400021 [Vibrio chagasii]
MTLSLPMWEAYIQRRTATTSRSTTSPIKEAMVESKEQDISPEVDIGSIAD